MALTQLSACFSVQGWWCGRTPTEDIEINYNTSDKAFMSSWSVSIYSLHQVELIFNKSNLSTSFLLSKQLECNHYNCTKGKYFIQKPFTAPHHTKCPFAQSMLGAGSGFEDPTFGYNCTMPCVIIKMNRVNSEISLKTWKWNEVTLNEQYCVLFLQIINFLPSNHTDLPPYVNCTILVNNDCIYWF